MPIYEYHCPACEEEFTDLRLISARNAPAICPLCGHEAKRVILSAPRLTAMAKSVMQAHETNERSRHEPQTLDQYRSRAHGPGCSCCAAVSKGSAAERKPMKGGGSRPWMISH